MSKLHKTLTISGKVQGVGYRHSCLRIAHSMGLMGYVENLPNGNVCIAVEGSEKQLNLFIKWCFEGSKYANVENINIENGKLNNYNQFLIKY